jgi:hypothetical protein
MPGVRRPDLCRDFAQIQHVTDPVTHERIARRLPAGIAARSIEPVVARDHFLDRREDFLDRGFASLTHLLPDPLCFTYGSVKP